MQGVGSDWRAVEGPARGPDRHTIWSECMWTKKKSHAVPARHRLKKSTAVGLGAGGGSGPCSYWWVGESPVGSSCVQDFCRRLLQWHLEESTGARAQPEMLRESQPREEQVPRAGRRKRPCSCKSGVGAQRTRDALRGSTPPGVPVPKTFYKKKCQCLM